MTIKASEVKLLREKTGLGMMECKNALVHFMPHERGFVQCHLSMTQCQHKGQMLSLIHI